VAQADEGLHLGAGAAGGDDAAADLHAPGRAGAADLELDLDLVEGQRVGERDELAGALGPLDAGQAGHGEGVALGQASRRITVSAPERTRHEASATRRVTGLSETSTMCASPAASRWLKGAPIGGIVDRGAQGRGVPRGDHDDLLACRRMRLLHLRPAATALLVASALLVAAGGLAWAAWVEPYHRLEIDRIRLPLLAGEEGNFRIVHLADLHVRADDRSGVALLDRIGAEVAAARPRLVAISGDLWDDVADPTVVAANIEAAADFAARLGAVAPVVAVQGHSDHLGDGVARLAAAGVRWLANESLAIDTEAGPFLLVGLSQQAGFDELVRELRTDRPRFTAHPQATGGPLWGATLGDDRGTSTCISIPRRSGGHRRPGHGRRRAATNPAAPPGRPADRRRRRRRSPGAATTPPSRCGVSDRGTGAGLVVHSRLPLGEDRMLRLRRVAPHGAGDGSFVLVAHGTAFTAGAAGHRRGARAGAVVPAAGGDAGRRRRPRRRRQGLAGGQPRSRPLAGLGRGPLAAPPTVAGTVGLWAWGGGTVLYRDLAVAGADGAPLYASPLGPTGDAAAAGMAPGTRGSRLALALAKAPPMPPETPRIVLTHSPDATPEAAWRGVEAVLAGHTHGGQIALPGQGALITRSALGRHYDAGTFHFAAFNRRGWTTLYVNAGFGTTLLPLRFAAPPRLAVVELLPRVD
jgi:predicted MPP superfamily phosphohydrolase